MATHASPASLAEYYDRRFAHFAEEATDHIQRVEERRRTLQTHHQSLYSVEKLRLDVGRLQRRLTEVELQTLRERMRTLRVVAESQDLDVKQQCYREDMQRLLAVSESCTAAATTKIPRSAPADRSGKSEPAALCVLRVVETPCGDTGTQAVADQAKKLWQQIEQEAVEHQAIIDKVDAQRESSVAAQDSEVAAVRADLKQELSLLEAERERLARSIVGYVQMRTNHVNAQRLHACEIEALRSESQDIAAREEDIERSAHRQLHEERELVLKKVGEHVDYRRRLEEVDRSGAIALAECLDGAEGEIGARVALLVSELQTLKEKCAAHRRRRRLLLSGYRADLVVMSKKLEVLEAVAWQVCETLSQPRSRRSSVSCSMCAG